MCANMHYIKLKSQLSVCKHVLECWSIYTCSVMNVCIYSSCLFSFYCFFFLFTRGSLLRLSICIV